MNIKLNLFLKGKYFEYLLLSIILILGFTVRLYKIGNPIADWHSWRQADTASVTYSPILRYKQHSIENFKSSRFPNG